MAHFYGTVQGGRGPAHRCGHKSTGLTVVAMAWQGSVTVQLYVAGGRDCVEIRAEVGGLPVTVYRGPLADLAGSRGPLYVAEV